MGYFKDLYNTTMTTADPLSSQYPLMGSPEHMLTMVALYVIICLQGPKFMEAKKPKQLKKTIVIYNFTMSLFNFYIFSTTIGGLLRKGYSVSCQHMDTDPVWLRVGWLFFMSKIVEFFDTVLFILTKKTSHVTFLHCYHHATMACFTWIGFKFLPGGARLFFLPTCSRSIPSASYIRPIGQRSHNSLTHVIYPALNSFIHVVMYIYYGMAAMGPHMRKYLWWKKYLTVMQMSQFIIFLIQGLINTIYQCPIPTVFKYSVYFYTLTILILFINFYIKAYIQKRSSTAEVTKNKKKSH